VVVPEQEEGQVPEAAAAEPAGEEAEESPEQ
jgi:hypothetical protein